MFDDLRKSASESYEEFDSEAAEDIDLYDYEDEYDKPVKARRSIFGITAPQRFLLASILFFMSCVLGGFCLILTDKISLPFF